MIPGQKSRRLAARLRKVESRNVTFLSDEFPVFWESAQGSWVRDVDGNRFLDLSGAFAVSSLGHCSSAVQRALSQQSKKLWHGMGDVHPSAVKVELLEALRDIAPRGLSVSILSSSGAEAVESALKTARLKTGKPGVIAFDGAYHGLSYGTLPITDPGAFVQPFRNQVGTWGTHLPYPDALRGRSESFCLETLERYLKSNNPSPVGPVGAVIVEPIQGRGGVRVPRPEFLQGLRRLTHQLGILLIVDEIFTGFGRTGRDFGVDHAGIVPDLICLGKALGNGFPISACIGTTEVMSAWPASDGEAIHTSTFLGNPLGCAMALASIREFKRLHLSRRAAKLGEAWKDELKQELGSHPNIGEIRGAGFMIGIELVKDRTSLAPFPDLAGRIVKGCLQRGMIVLSGGMDRNVLTLTPPLTISEKDLRRATRTLVEVLSHE